MFLKGSKEMEITGPHTVNQTCDLLWCYSWEVMDCSPSSPDLKPSDFHLLGPHKKHLTGKKFAADADVK
jgi:hypothetical protein